ncbi:MAG: ABC transporter ATP-binding protein [Cellulosilyticaceae bacterium]
MQKVIVAKSLKKTYGEKVVVDDLSFHIHKGEFFGLLGHNGAGKSTTIDCVLGVRGLDEGEVEILGMIPKEQRKKLFEKVGVQFQQSAYQDKIKVEELCEEIAILYEEAEDYHQMLEDFGLRAIKKQYVSTLSGGEKQKLSILLALIGKPEIVFLDELTIGLDTVARRSVWKQLSSLKEKGMTVFLTSHYMDEVEALCDRVCILKNGKELISGTVDEVIENSPYEDLEEAYLWYMGEECV